MNTAFPTVLLDGIFYKKQEWISLQYPHNARIDKIVKSITDRQFSFSKKLWLVPFSKKNYAFLHASLKPICNLNVVDLEKYIKAKNTKIELVENINKELSAILVHELESTWKSEFTKKKEHKKIGKVLKSLNVSQISSFVADSEKITFKLKSSSLVSIGYGDFNNEYDLQVQSYSLN
jgi:hypothetical protein